MGSAAREMPMNPDAVGPECFWDLTGTRDTDTQFGRNREMGRDESERHGTRAA